MIPERADLPLATTVGAADPMIPTVAVRPRSKLLQFPALAEEKAPSRPFLLFEFVILFVGLPVVLYCGFISSVPPLYMLWVAAGYALVILLRDPRFDRRQLWRSGALRAQLPQILALFAAGVVVVTALVHAYAPQLFLSLVRMHPIVWAVVMAMYPIVSVYPQALIYRAYLFHRYEPLVQTERGTRWWILILASAATFALVHILFHNWIAVALTLPGGILFARRYLETRSLCVSSVEHTLYGCFLFTVGLGQFFGVKVF